MTSTRSQSVLFLLLLLLLLSPGCVEAAFRSYDGTGNNVFNSVNRGAANSPLLRIAPAAYEDGISVPRGMQGNVSTLPNPRNISNIVCRTIGTGKRSSLRNSLLTAWGQFLAHDITLTEPPSSGKEPINIPVPMCDEWFDPQCTNRSIIRQSRTKVYSGTGTSTANPREQLNEATSFVDASHIYGTNGVTAGKLRTLQGGKLKTSAGNLLPFNSATQLNMQNPLNMADSKLFACGDIRCNENPMLISLTTLLVREHNRKADQLVAQDATLSDEQLYQQARQHVIAVFQSILVNEYLPAIIGQRLPDYAGYKANVNPAVANGFASAAFRYGHSEANSVLRRLDAQGRTIPERDQLMRDSFFNPASVSQVGIDAYLRGLVNDPQGLVDVEIVSDMRNFLFGRPAFGGHDLVALNINRGREHGVPSYNAMRQAYGLVPVSTFDQITSDTEVQNRLKEAYRNDVSLVDAYIGGLAEDTTGDSNLGALFRAVVMDQYQRLRDGDRFWFENTAEYSGAQIAEWQATTLRQLVARNTGLSESEMAANAFLLPKDGGAGAGTTSNGVSTQVVTTGWPNSLSVLDGKMTLHWRVSDTYLDMMVSAQTTGWVGVGFNPSDRGMTSADMVIGWFDDTTKVAMVDDYYSRGYLPPVKDTSQQGSSSLIARSASQTAGFTMIQFRRPLAINSSTDRPIVANSNTVVVFAMGDRDVLEQHARSARGVADINFQQGTSALTFDLRVIHAILMAAGFVIAFVPSVVYLRYYGLKITDAVRVHVRLVAVGFALSTAGMIIIFSVVREHFASTHAYLGVLVFVLLLMQPIRAYRPVLGSNGQKKPRLGRDRLHRINGHYVILLGITCMALGMVLMTVHIAVYVVFGVWVATFFGILAWNEIKRYDLWGRRRKYLQPRSTNELDKAARALASATPTEGTSGGFVKEDGSGFSTPHTGVSLSNSRRLLGQEPSFGSSPRTSVFSLDDNSTTTGHDETTSHSGIPRSERSAGTSSLRANRSAGVIKSARLPGAELLKPMRSEGGVSNDDDEGSTGHPTVELPGQVNASPEVVVMDERGNTLPSHSASAESYATR